MKFKNQIKHKISIDLESGFEALNISLSTDSKFYDEFLLLQSRYNKVKRETRLGVVSWDIADLEQTKITKSLFDLINLLQENDVLINQITSQDETEVEESVVHQPEEFELGYLDYLELSNENKNILNDSILNMTKLIDVIGQQMNLATRNLDILNKQKATEYQKIKHVKEISNDLAVKLNDFDGQLKIELGRFNSNSTTWLDNQHKALKLSYESGIDSVDDLKVLLIGIEQFNKNLDYAKSCMNVFYQSVASLPNVTLKFNIAKNKASNTLLELIDGLDKIIEKSNQYHDNIWKTIEEV